MAFRVTVGRGGYVVIPKAVRDLVGIREGDTLFIKVEGRKIILEPEVRVDVDELRRRLRQHRARIRRYLKKEPRLGDLSRVSLEEEFDE